MTGLFLYAEVMGYNVACFRELVASYNVDLHVVRWDKRKLTPYIPPTSPRITYYNRSEYSLNHLSSLAAAIAPDLLFISGWMDHDYLALAKDYRPGVPVVCGSDSAWRGSLRQWTSVMGARYFFRPYFTHFFVPGSPQYSFVSRLGYPRRALLTGSYSCDVDYFDKCFAEKSAAGPTDGYPHVLLYVGRFAAVKGLDLLIDAFTILCREARYNWQLRLFGNGPDKGALKARARGNTDIEFHDFVDPAHLGDVFAQAGAFCLPSRKEPWGVVLHEAAAAGLPLIASNAVGSATAFLQDGINGFSFLSGNQRSLLTQLQRLFDTPDSELWAMSNASNQLAKVTTPRTWAATLMSIMQHGTPA